jgi:DNA-binding response OmpR family regulator
VDDDDDLGRVIVRFLRQKGLDAVSYTSAEHLRVALETTNFDGYILDWVLGEESANALLPLIRAKNPVGPVIILTGQIDAGAEESDLASALTTYRAQLYEKPSRALSLFNALELGFDASARTQ